MEITYSLNLTITRTVRLSDFDDTLHETAAWMVGPEAKRELEKEVLRAMRVLDGDCDVEVMETERTGVIEEEDDEPKRKLTHQERLQGMADRGIDTWDEFREDR